MAIKHVSGSVVSSSSLKGQQSVFKDYVRVRFEHEAEKAQYNPNEDPFLQDHKRKVNEILKKSYA